MTVIEKYQLNRLKQQKATHEDQFRRDRMSAGRDGNLIYALATKGFNVEQDLVKWLCNEMDKLESVKDFSDSSIAILRSFAAQLNRHYNIETTWFEHWVYTVKN